MARSTKGGAEYLKATFWRKIEANSMLDASKLGLSEIAKLAGGGSGLISKLQDPSYYEWFMDRDYSKTLLASGLNPSIERLINIVNNADGEASVAQQLQAAKVLMDANGFSSRKSVEDSKIEKDVSDMTEEELRKRVEKGLKKLSAVE